MLFEGSAVALVTPFDSGGQVNYLMIKKLIEFQISNGTKAIVILGTTGESPTISSEEREKIIKFTVCLVAKRVPVIVGTGSNSTKNALEQTIQAKNLGADGALVVTPYYNKCSRRGLYEHFKTIALKSKFPLIIYNVPARTGVGVTTDIVLKLSKIKYIVGIKEASGNIGFISELVAKLPKRFAVYSGDDGITLPAMSVGARGVISVTANCYPDRVEALCEFMRKKDLFNAQVQQDFLFEINRALFLEVNPICVKFYLGLIGFDVGKPRLPLTLPEQETIKKLKEISEFYEN